MASVFEQVASQLGLSYGTKPGLLPLPQVTGELDGQPVRCTWGDRAARVEALFEPQLDLGLHVRAWGFANVTALGPRIQLDDSNWDDEVVATADEPARGAALFAADARGAVLRLNATSTDIDVSDAHVVTYVQLLDPEMLVQAFRQVARVASLIHAARRDVPAAGVLTAHARALRAFSREHRLQVEETPLHARGEVRSVQLAARFVRTGRNELDLEVRAVPVEIPTGFGLLVRRESALDRVRTFLGGQDVRTDDPAFDPAFLVRAQDTERAVAALDGDVRALLLDLHARFEHVSLDEAALALRTPASRVRPEDLVMLLEAACTVVERVARAAAVLSRGAYR